MSMEIKISSAPVGYEEAVAAMEQRVGAIRAGMAPEMVWFLEHPPIYTAGTSAKVTDLLDPRFPVFQTGRGGQYTYHGPGQRVIYAMIDLKKRRAELDLKRYVHDLEHWIIDALALLGIKGQWHPDRVGIWIHPPAGREEKIAALGVRVKWGVAYHGLAINVDPDLSHFNGIVPCGLSGYGVTSVAKVLGRPVGMAEVDQALLATRSVLMTGKLDAQEVAEAAGQIRQVVA